jgi:protein CpxP
MKSLKNKFFIGLTAVAITAAGGVFAQNAGMGMGAMHGADGMDHAKMHEKMKAGMEKHQAQLHAKLKLSEAQEPAWKTFIAASTPTSMPTPPERKEMDKLTTPERMEKMLERSQEHQSKMQQRLTALKTFYAVLTPEQQKIFDDSHRNMRHQGMQHKQPAEPAKASK